MVFALLFICKVRTLTDVVIMAVYLICILKRVMSQKHKTVSVGKSMRRNHEEMSIATS